jgi:protein-tyrosine-phosphatase
VLDLVPTAADRCQLVCDTDVEDPAGRPVEVYAACADRLEACLRRKLDEVEP